MPGFSRFLAPRDASGLVEVGEAVGHHLRMDAEVADAAVEQERADRIRHAADADLQAVAVFDVRRDEPPHRAIDRRRRRIRQLRRGRVVALDDVVHFAHVHARLVAVDVRQPAARLDDDHPGALDDRAVPQVGGAQVEAAVLVDRARLQDDDVDRGDEAPVVVRDLTEIDRDVAAAPRVVHLPVVGGEVQAEPMDARAVGIRIQHGPRPHRQAVADLDVRQVVDAGGQRPVEDIGLAQCPCRSRATCRLRRARRLARRRSSARERWPL